MTRCASTLSSTCGFLVLALLAGCGPAGNGRPESAEPSAGETPAATTSAGRDEAESAAGATDDRVPAPTPEDPTEAALALIEAFRDGNRRRAGALYPFRRWGDEEGFEKMAEGYRELEFDLRPESIRVFEEAGASQVAIPATGDDTKWIYVFFVFEEDGTYKVDSVEARVAGVP